LTGNTDPVFDSHYFSTLDSIRYAYRAGGNYNAGTKSRIECIQTIEGSK